MAPALATEHVVYDDPEEASEDLYRILGLENKLHVYKAIQKAIHQRVDQFLDLCVPAEGQKENLDTFLQQVLDDFPGYFRNKPDSKKRKTLLREYARRYLDVKRLELNLERPAQNIIRATRPTLKLHISPRTHSELTDVGLDVDMDSPLPNHSTRSITPEEIQVDTPPASKRRVTFAIHESPEPSPEPAREQTPSFMSLESMPECSPSSDFLFAAFASLEPSPAPDLTRLTSPEPDLSMSSPQPEFSPAPDFSVSPQPSPSPSMQPKFSPVPDFSVSSQPSLSPDPESEPEAQEQTPETWQGPIEVFLSGCYPPMPHCARPFHLAGVVEADHLRGMARWPEERLSTFLTKQDITRTPLENAALMIGFENLLGQGSVRSS
ncbi:hypothetical protein FB45DRAFT_1001106 [Roridomyces roridus]|uniref:Uncharacterized protein n=1 Tax=Roridomyces roridus TaxID=1738132 RepID=A0AAD7FRU6_9AGAR|nr:hypothetical protein FB45DRAFT_1001106 [Roridomyces roridus]